MPTELENSLLCCLSKKVHPDRAADPNLAITYLREQEAEQQPDFALIRTDYIGRPRTHLLEDNQNRLRLIRWSAPTPIASLKKSGSNGNEATTTVSSYWLEAWAGPEKDPDPVPGHNVLFEFEVPIASIREYVWINFEGIIILDISTFTSNPQDKKMKALFKSEAPTYVRCEFVKGTYVGHESRYTVLVLDRWVLNNAEECEISNIPQSKFRSAVFRGDRLIELGSDNSGVVVSIGCTINGAAEIWKLLLAWDDSSKPAEVVEISGMLEDRFVLVSTSSPG